MAAIYYHSGQVSHSNLWDGRKGPGAVGMKPPVGLPVPADGPAGAPCIGSVASVPRVRPDPLDEYPIHQSPLSMLRVATSDRNFYDRNYFNAFDQNGENLLITGGGYYPNVGVKDAFLSLRRADRQWTVR